jgi:4-hydroxy-3-polyprenylbenzoate decarboxylase
LKNIFLGITGASGAVYAIRLLEELNKRDFNVSLTVTDDGLININLELSASYSSSEDFVNDFGFTNVTLYHYRDFAAPVSSGSNTADLCLVAPASMGCVGRIASGISSNLVERCADVVLKENKKLLLLVREAPYNSIHLRNMLYLSEIGVTIMPASPAFYYNPSNIDDMINFIVGKIFDIMGIEHNLFKRWT